jgi:hypothetical protein
MPDTVWLVNESGHHYEPAKLVAGPDAEIKPLTVGSVNILRPDRIADHLARGITRFVSREDYLLFSGSPVINALALHLWLSMHGVCKTLTWDAKKREYSLATLTAEQLSSLIERELARG